MKADFFDRLQEHFRGRYQLERLLGEGGTATVYRAHDVKHHRPVAVKVLRPEVAATYGSARFLSEVQVTAGLQHPNILPLFDSGEVDGLPYYVMPHVTGQSLRDCLSQEAPLSPARAIGIARCVAAALDHAHRQGIVHRDIKPGNILLTDDEALVSDFGIALVVALDDERLTKTGSTVGTLAYMSPEQASGHPIDFRSDIYSFGCVVYEMLTGRTPFEGSNALILRSRHKMQLAPSLRAIRPELSATLDEAVQMALAKDPDERHRSAGEFVAALEAAHGRSRRDPGPLRRLAVASVAVATVGIGAWAVATHRSVQLDANRIVIYPLVSSGPTGAQSPIGEEVATMIGTALDGTGPLRWIDGWTFLDPERRDDVRGLSLDDARRIARDRDSAYFITGRVVRRADSVEIFLDLHDTRGDAVVARARQAGLAGDAWGAGLVAVNELLPVLIPGGAPDVSAEWRDRHPAAIANFLLGESSFRRVQVDQALGYYRSAVETDSSFAIAALRGAQAASWAHDDGEAQWFIDVASRYPLAPHYDRFVVGYTHYLSGEADSAANAFRAAVEIAPEVAAAWAQLGEVYTHLLPLTGNADSIADVAFDEARRLDASDANFLLHPTEILLRRGDLEAATTLLERFAEASPTSVDTRKLRIMESCVRDGANRVPWLDLARDVPDELLKAAKAIGRNDCASEAFRAILEVDTASGPDDPDMLADGRRWAALMGAFGIALARDDTGDAVRLADSYYARWEYGSTIFLFVAPLYPQFVEQARFVASSDRSRWGHSYGGCVADPWCPRRLWELGVFEVEFGSVEVAATIAQRLPSLPAVAGQPPPEALARSLEAFVTLARGDTALAVQRLGEVVPRAVTSGPLMWDEVEPRGLERLTLARLLLAQGSPREAFEVARMFDSTRPLVYLLFRPASLELRISAARTLGDEALARNLEARLDRIHAGR